MWACVWSCRQLQFAPWELVAAIVISMSDANASMHGEVLTSTGFDRAVRRITKCGQVSATYPVTSAVITPYTPYSPYMAGATKEELLPSTNRPIDTLSFTAKAPGCQFVLCWYHLEAVGTSDQCLLGQLTAMYPYTREYSYATIPSAFTS